MIYMKNENFLFELLRLGKARFQNGQFIIFNATNLIFPTRSFLFLMRLLTEKYGREECEKILKEVGKFQIKQAAVRYSQLFQIEKIDKRKILSEFSPKIGELLGLGVFELRENEVILKNNPIAFEFKEMYGMSKIPIDAYLCGILEEVYSLLGKPVEVKETKCIACGDPYCQFEVFPAEEKKETKT